MEPEVSLPLSHVLSSSIQCLLPNPSSWIWSLILPSHLRLGVRRCPFPSIFLIKTLYTSLFSQIHVPCPSIHIVLDLISRKILNEVTGHWAPRHVVFPFPCYLVPFRTKWAPRHLILKHALQVETWEWKQLSKMYAVSSNLCAILLAMLNSCDGIG